jgi:predicted ATP-dependent protease
MSASLTFEQCHGPVEGDSASVAELLAVLSALAGVAIKQGIAVTGSVSQDGAVGAVGGVNEKIEGFFDVCRLGGLRGDQGVAIPAVNAQQLMLRADVVQAVADGQFHVYGIGHVDELITLLTGLEAGARQEDGTFPEASFNRLVEDRLAEFAEKRRERGYGGDGEEESDMADEGGPGRRRPRRPREAGRAHRTPTES